MAATVLAMRLVVIPSAARDLLLADARSRSCPIWSRARGARAPAPLAAEARLFVDARSRSCPIWSRARDARAPAPLAAEATLFVGQEGLQISFCERQRAD